MSGAVQPFTNINDRQAAPMYWSCHTGSGPLLAGKRPCFQDLDISGGARHATRIAMCRSASLLSAVHPTFCCRESAKMKNGQLTLPASPPLSFLLSRAHRYRMLHRLLLAQGFRRLALAVRCPARGHHQVADRVQQAA